MASHQIVIDIRFFKYISSDLKSVFLIKSGKVGLRM